MKNIVFVLLLCLCGCVSKGWYQDGKTAEETRRDIASCDLEAAHSSNPLAMANEWFAMADVHNRNEIFEDCMIAKGYQLVAMPSVPNTNGPVLSPKATGK